MQTPPVTPAGPLAPGAGVVHCFPVDPRLCNGFGWCAHVDRYRTADGSLVDDVLFGYSRFGHTPADAYETCLRAMRDDGGRTYAGIAWTLETSVRPEPVPAH